MKTQIQKYLKATQVFLPVLLLLLNSCTEEMYLPLDTTYARLVVYGELTTDTTTHTVSITQSLDYYDPQTPVGISGAKVMLHWDNNSQLLTENTTAQGIYETPPDFYGEQGKLYRLTIEDIDFDKNGESELYEAESYLAPFTKMDHIDYEIDEMFGIKVLSVKLYGQEPPELNFYRFRWSMNDTMLTKTLGDWALIDDIYFNGRYIQGFPIINFAQIEDSDNDNLVIFDSGDKFTLELATISREYYDFILECLSVTGMQTPMTSSTPGNVKSNFNNNVIGFFTTYGISRASFVYDE